MDGSILRDAILNGLVNSKYQGHAEIGPELLTNSQDATIWQVLRRELLTCRNFTWVVAFITPDMLVPFKVVMADLAQKGVSGTIITGSYLNFNQPVVFEELQKIPNLTVKIASSDGFHVKGYLFDHDQYQTMIIGSANFTRSALLVNKEWNLKLSSYREGTLFQQVANELATIKKYSEVLDAAWIANYRRQWRAPSPNSAISKPAGTVTPNKMQIAALKQLTSLINSGAKKGLVVSATGTGKTYLGAFAVKNYQPRRFLYVVHREQIARKSMASFHRVIGGSLSDYGLLTGNQRDWHAKYLFATVQTLSQPSVLNRLNHNEFDYILIDEAHRAAAPSYRRVFEHFTPQFWLGMTATPERMDNQDVYRLFDYHLAYEIRLREALAAKMLAPFHYVGVADYELGGELISETSKLSQLAAPKRVKYILKQLDYYGYCGHHPRGLVFCSRQEEAKALAKQFSAAGHPAKALTNQNSPQERRGAVDQLENGTLEYLITVDLFNEGVDIPSLNQIIMMRNTQSPIVFTQQLGRGLRKYPEKDYVTVIDFIGNYKHNYMIPLALNQDNSRNKDRARQEVKLPTSLDVSTINFSRIAEEHILTSLDHVKLDSMRELRQAYQDLAQQLGRSPLLLDFYQYGSVAPQVFAHNARLDHYGAFLEKMGHQVELTNYESKVLMFLTKELLDGKRPHELVLLQMLAAHGSCTIDEFKQELTCQGIFVSANILQSVDSILNLDFFAVKSGKQLKKDQYGGRAIVNHSDLFTYQLNPAIQEGLGHHKDFSQLFNDVIVTGLKLAKAYDFQAAFTLYQQYDRKDVCRLLDWPLDVSAPMYGYRVAEDVCPIFITYHKESPKKRNAIYNNQFQDGRSIRWYTRAPRHLSSAEVQRLLAGVKVGQPKVKLHLFIKSSDAVGKDFYYLGTAHIQPGSVAEELIGPKKKTAVGMNLILDHPLPPSILDLLAV
ncbi:DEAD/DEAH box helicase [Limosilactobacillus sp. STM2_1]|uniref:DEAD/DEAH box helicase n=1 Tax=Limosilactobacillus rudii TaxID=2759755 RepID=A0A7W3UMY6_9LACO|nr:DEAD/DEAH box helicase [Limosilactobacillus rudii]MBB1079289.1 DEAD/DEAH box helicase [Limosilactobacillus rudii]MBB1098517.1 DEAD/DEAH box helicase [Limosilactobacillus rudii]MCD7135526.1 DEAD/DEAH box helicase [Limosilactobacillus rudii]